MAEKRWLRVASVENIPPGLGRQVRVLGRAVAVFNAGGRFLAVDGMCRHMNAPLIRGQLRGTRVTCGWHGWEYDLVSGQCLAKNWAKLTIYELKVEQGVIMVDVGPIYKRLASGGEEGGKAATDVDDEAEGE